MPPMVCNACCCNFVAIDPDNFTFCCKSQGEFLCCTQKACCAVDEQLLCPFLMEPDMGECCVLGCGLCTYGLKVPSTCCNSWSRCLCFVSAESFPCTDSAWVEACMCAWYGINCAPQCGCCSAPKFAIPTKIGVAKGQAETQAMDRP